MSAIPTATAYLTELTGRIAGLIERNAEAIARSAEAIEATARSDGLVYVFGTGHSHMLAEEAHYRAGGLALIVPILSAATMLHEGAAGGTVLERIPGFVAPLLARYPIGPKDVLVVASNSGVNAAPVEAAQIGRQRGATIIAITSRDYSATVAKGRPRIADIADIVLDNGAPPGDAITGVPDSVLRVGPVSTAIGAALINAVIAEAAARLQAAGEKPPVYRSANLPDAAETNAALVARYRPRNPHL